MGQYVIVLLHVWRHTTSRPHTHGRQTQPNRISDEDPSHLFYSNHHCPCKLESPRNPHLEGVSGLPIESCGFAMDGALPSNISYDVILQVVEWLRNDYHSLYRCSLSSRTFRDVAATLLYRQVTYSPSHRSVVRILDLRQRDDFVVSHEFGSHPIHSCDNCHPDRLLCICAAST